MMALSTKVGIVLLIDGKSEPHEVRLKISKDLLTIQHQEVVCVTGSQCSAKERSVTLRRQEIGGFGLSIKGGAEYRVPVVISKIMKDQAADQTGMLFIGDAILRINGINVENATHEEVVQVLQTAGDEVTFTVRYLRKIPAFLKLPLIEEGQYSSIPSDQSSTASSPLFDSGLHLNNNSTNTRWCDSLAIPLLLARISLYTPGSDQLRPNAFEVIAMDGISSGVLQCYSIQECADWLRSISTAIGDLIQQHIRMTNKNLSLYEQIVHMGWVEERIQDAEFGQHYQSRFLALRGPNMFLFSGPPLSLCDWARGEKMYDLCETFLKTHKEVDLRDMRPCCFSVLTGTGDSHYFSTELAGDVALWEKAYQQAQFSEVQRVGSKTYSCVWRGHATGLTVDFNLGFACFEANSKQVFWRYKFCQLKGSSDDGKSKIKFLFQKNDPRLIETKELEFPNLVAALHCIHSFISAKVALVDPLFVESQCGGKMQIYCK
ncbi:gamma-2-syntrophin-like isoform X3 [Petromyzon marinus]|uniref:Gamma-2-syntrophin-like isoform X3 n=1 Tax=Petromyzon marinus TaxID=7757 RepID=A0AAJ7WT30_PETMA|nr:gamma-2-syntrophin-like isoform X3 [Petromyzon marinus]